MDEMNELERQLADVVRGAMRQPRPVDADAIVRSAASDARGRRRVATRLRGRTSQAPTTRGSIMFSVLRFVTASVIVTLIGGFLLAGIFSTQQGDQMAPAAESVSLAPSGIEILSPASGATKGLVTGDDGVLWALEHPGRLVRLDADTNTTTAWTIADDVAFGQASSIAASSGGGVWLAGPDAARLFDSERFAQVIEAPEALTLVIEADDASLWAATEAGAVLHWDGSTWENIGPASSNGRDWILALEVDSAGRPWVGKTVCPSSDGPCGAEVMVFDGSGWTRFDRSDASPLGGWAQSILESPDGSIWIATEGGLARFDGSAWTVESPASGSLYLSLAASPDGTVWASSILDSARVWRLDGVDWAKFASAEGLPEEDWSARLAVVGDRVFLGTDAGTYERVGEGWKLAWNVSPTRLHSPRLLATGDDALWVVDSHGVRSVTGGAWTDELDWSNQVSDTTPDWSLRDLALGPDGTVWVAGPDGIAYRDGERWEFVDEEQAGAVTVDANGTVWVARPGQAAGCRLWALTNEDGAWVREDIDGCPLEWIEGDLSLGADGDGAIWLGTTGGWGHGSLVRYTDGVWEAIDEVEGTDVAGGIILGTDAEGAVWVLILKDIAARENETWIVEASVARLADGDVIQVAAVPGDVEVGWGGAALASDGRPWAMSARGPARFDGQVWQFPYGDAALPWLQVGAVAPDGSVYGIVAETGDIVRYLPSSERSGQGPKDGGDF